MKDLDPKHGIACFVDGSVGHDKAGGWAWVGLDAFGNSAEGYGYAVDTTIGKMELTAPTQALAAVLFWHGPSDVLVYCDSQYVVLGCQDRNRKRNVNFDEWSMLDYWVDRHVEVQFIHVKGHDGNKNNERVDKLAVRARKEQLETTYES